MRGWYAYRSLMSLNLENAARFVYEDSPLKLVVAQVRFPAVLEITTQPPAAFQKRIMGVFPLLTEAAQIEFTVTPSDSPIQKSAGRIWTFTDETEQWSCTLSSDSIALQTEFYEGFELFHERFMLVYEAFLDIYAISRAQRFGLRYVNTILGKPGWAPADWREYINPELIGPLTSEVFRDVRLTSLQELRMQLDPGILQIKHGLLGDRSSGDQEEYVVDFDRFIEGRIGAKDVPDYLLDFRATIYKLFCWSINQTYRDQLTKKSGDMARGL